MCLGNTLGGHRSSHGEPGKALCREVPSKFQLKESARVDYVKRWLWDRVGWAICYRQRGNWKELPNSGSSKQFKIPWMWPAGFGGQGGWLVRDEVGEARCSFEPHQKVSRGVPHIPRQWKISVLHPQLPPFDQRSSEGAPQMVSVLLSGKGSGCFQTVTSSQSFILPKSDCAFKIIFFFFMKWKTLSPEKSISGLSEQVFSQGGDGGRGEGEPLEHLKITLSWLHPVEN